MLVLTSTVLVLILTAGLAYAERDRVVNELHQLGAEAGLKLRHIQVRGRSHISKATLLAALNIQLNVPIFSINLQDLHNRVSQIGWVKNVIIERRLPSTIHVVLDERVPVALLQNDTDHQLIDATGAVINGADPRDFTHLKVVVGENAAANAAPILEALKSSGSLRAELVVI